MLQEIGAVRQDSALNQRRWFQDDYFDLYVWQDDGGTPIAFQLCFARNRAEGVIHWRAAEGFAHAQVDGGERAGAFSRAPVLRAGTTPPYFRIYNRFLQATSGWEPALRQFMVERLREYRHALFGVPRKPRRRRRALG